MAATTSLQCVDYLSLKFGAQSLRDFHVPGPKWSLGIPCYSTSGRTSRKEDQEKKRKSTEFLTPRICNYQAEGRSSFILLPEFRFESCFGSLPKNLVKSYTGVNSNFNSDCKKNHICIKNEELVCEKRRIIEPVAVNRPVKDISEEIFFISNEKGTKDFSKDSVSDSEEELLEIFSSYISKENRYEHFERIKENRYEHLKGIKDEGLKSPRKRGSTESLDFLNTEENICSKRMRPSLSFEKMHVASYLTWNSEDDVDKGYFLPISRDWFT